MSNTAVCLQVRLSSTRLPGKALLSLAGRPVVEHALERLAGVPADQYWILTDEQSADALGDLARLWGFHLYAGDAHDVLKRFCDCAAREGWQVIVRATGDNPLVSRELATAAIDLRDRSGADYAGYLGSPVGTGVEVVRVAALQEVHATTVDPYEREHVTPGIYRNPHRFSVVLEEAPREMCLPDSRVTIDTMEDFRRLQKLFGVLRPEERHSLRALVAALRREAAPRETL